MSDHLGEVGNGLEDAVVGHRCVHDRVWSQFPDHGLVIGGGHAERASEICELTGVLPHLAWIGDPNPNQIQLRMGVHTHDRMPTDRARGPNHYSLLGHHDSTSGIGIEKLGTCKPPSTSSTLPVR